MDVQGYNHNENLKYHKEFCWVRDNSDGTVTIGLNDFYQKLSGELQYIDMPSEDETVEMDERIGTIQTGKWLGKLVSPVSGTVVEVNSEIEDDPALVNRSPYEEGWLLKIRLSNQDELNQLLSGDDAVEWLKAEIAEHA